MTMESQSDEKPFVKNQKLLNIIFSTFELSFNKPNKITISLTTLKRRFSAASRPGSSTLSQREWDAARNIARDLWGLLEEISTLEKHRHRISARNILAEVRNRIRGLPATMVNPCPEFLPYTEPRCSSNEASETDSPTLLELEGIKGRRLTGQPIPPVPERSVPGYIGGENDYLPAENTMLSQLITQRYRPPDALEILRKTGATNPGPPPPVYLDDPVESLIYYSDDFPLLTGPYPRIFVPPETVVRPEVYDLRRCSETHGRLENRDSYIFKLVCRVQDTVLRPEVVFKYVIVMRATRGRFLDPSTDDVEKEPAATEEEVTHLTKWFSKGFPKIFVRQNPVQDLSICGEHDRNRDPSSIDINADQLDVIEQLQRDGKSAVHLIYQIYVTLFHELAHYLNTQLNALNNRSYLTPRKLRWELKPQGLAEHREHPRHNIFFPYAGEIGELVEFLIFGHMMGVIPGEDKAFARAWGTESAKGTVILPTEVVMHMLASRAPRWMDGPKLREVIRGYELQRDKELPDA